MNINCNFIHCLAGMGLAGMDICFLRGEKDNPNCPKFEDEQEWYIENHLRNILQSRDEYGGEV